MNNRYSRNSAKQLLVNPALSFLDIFKKEKTAEISLESLESGDEKAILECIQKYFNKFPIAIHVTSVPGGNTRVETNCNFNVNNSSTISVKLNFPELITDNPSVVYSSLVDVIIGIFSIVPTLKKLYASMYIPRINQKGHEYQACVISTIIDVDTYNDIVVENIDAKTLLSNFPCVYKLNNNIYEDVTPYSFLNINKKTSKEIDLDTIDPIRFESLFADLLLAMGIKAKTTKITNDGGIDIVGINEESIVGGKYIVQCKRYKSTISSGHIRDLYGVVMHERANKGIFVTTSDFSNECIKFAQDKPLELINREKLINLLQKYDLNLNSG